MGEADQKWEGQVRTGRGRPKMGEADQKWEGQARTGRGKPELGGAGQNLERQVRTGRAVTGVIRCYLVLLEVSQRNI